MLKIIREILLKIVNDIDTGNSNLSPEECEEVIEYLYLTGEIGQSMFKIAKRFLCDDCRQKLVIEIKEIDKKD